jgi:hypothetical protein
MNEINLKIDSSVDRDYAKEYLNSEQRKCDSMMNRASSASKYLYHKYLLGEDVGGILKNEEFYLNFFHGDELFFCREMMPTAKEDAKTEVVTDIEVDDNCIESLMPVEPPPQYRFQLTDELYADIYKQTFEFICHKELLRLIQGDFYQSKLSSLPISSKVLPALGSSSDENVFNGVPLILVKVFFNQLCNKKALTPTQLDNFILRAFQGDLSIEKQTLNTIETKEIAIINLFHIFYRECTAIPQFEPQKNSIKKYKGLLTENFTNWENRDELKNFSRTTSYTIWHKETVIKLS